MGLIKRIISMLTGSKKRGRRRGKKGGKSIKVKL